MSSVLYACAAAFHTAREFCLSMRRFSNPLPRSTPSHR